MTELMYRKYEHLEQYISGIKGFWKRNPQEITVEEQVCYYKIKEELTYEEEEMQWLAYEMENLLPEISFWRKIYVYSFLMGVMGDGSKYAMELIQLIMEDGRLDPRNEYFLYFQILSKVFLGKIKDNVDLKVMMYQFLKEIAGKFINALSKKPMRIPEEERDQDMVLVVTDQFLGLAHGPTKSTLARCAALKRNGKKVLLINTAELMPKVGKICGFEFFLGNYQEENSALQQVEWQGTVIPFFQCDNNMPDLEVLEYLIDVVRNKLKPYYVVAIGGESIFAFLLQEMVPVLAVGMVFSDVEISLVDYQTLGRKLNERDLDYLQKIGKSEMQVIEHKFTSDLREQKIVLTREEIGLSGFVITVVGGRLESELMDDFWEMLEGVLAREQVTVLLLGPFRRGEEVIEKHPILKGALRCEGVVQEVLAYMELCDLYVNPIRTGGGISCVEAMIKGVPVVTVAKGDVGVNAGEWFAVKDYEKMQETILRYIRDKDFYAKQSERAKKRAEELTDTDQEFWNVICEFLRRTGLSAGDKK